MRKLKLFFACLLMAVLSIGQVWAAETVYKTATFAVANCTSNSSYTGSVTCTIGTDSWTAAYAANNNGKWDYIKMGGKRPSTGGSTVHTGTIVTSASYSEAITKVVVNGSLDRGSVSAKLIYASNAAFTSDKVESSALTAFTDGKMTFTIASPVANRYYKLEFECTNGTTTNGVISISSVEYYIESGAPATPTCATPTFSPAAGAVVSGTQVSISCSTEGAAIHYTTDGTDPTASSATYSAAIPVNSAMTIKAIAVKAGLDNSSVASASYTVLTPLTTMDQIFAAATTAGSTATPVAITFNNWVVTGVKNKNVYVTDGTKGFIVFQQDHGFQVGDILSGTAVCKVQLYNGSAELTELTASKVTVNTGGSVSPVVLDAEGIAALTGANTGSVIKISGACTYENNKYYIAGVQLYNQLYSFSVSAGTNYDCTGVYVQYNTTKEILPRSAADIVAQTSVANPTFSPAGGEYTEVKNVTLSCTTNGATIYYTTDGSTPTNESAAYSSAITVDASMTIKAIAYKGEDHSEVVSATYTINLPIPSHDFQITHNFTTGEGFEFPTGWGGSYAEHEIAYTDDKVHFASASHQSGTITDRPVTKDQAVSLILTNSHKLISAVRFDYAQWGTKAQTLTMKYSTDGGETYKNFDPVVSSTDFALQVLTMPEGVNAIQVTGSNSSSQVGLTSIAFDLEDKPIVTKTVTITTPLNGTITVMNGEDEVSSGDAIEVNSVLTITATPDDGYILTEVTVNGSAYAESTLTLTENVTIAASFEENVAPDVNSYVLSEIGTETPQSITGLKVGDKVNLPLTATSCSKTFVGWDTDENCATEPTYAPGAEYTLALDNKLYAVYAYAGDAAWSVATSVKAGDVVVISTNTGYTANDMKTAGAIASSIFGATASTYGNENAQITELAEGTMEFTIGGNATDGWTLKNGTKYLKVTAAKKVGLVDDEETWTISFSGNNATLAPKTGDYTGYSIQYNYNTGNDRFTAYNTTQVAISLYKQVASYENYSTDCQAAVATPTFSPVAGTYTEVQNVTISTETADATIYYTTNGDVPTTSSTLYEGAIEVAESKTIKAIAVKSGMAHSAIASAAYTINLPLSTMDQIFAAATAAGSTATDANIQFNNWVVSGVSTNGKNVFVTDGTKGFIIFDNGGEMGFAVGDVLSGTVACKVQLYKGAAELTTLSSTTEGLSIAKEGVVTPVAKAITALSGINTGAPVIINSVQFDGTNLSDGANEIKPYNSLFAYDALENGKYYNVTGIYQQFDATKEILPRSAADIEEVNLADPEISYSPATLTITDGDAWSAPTLVNPHTLAIASYASDNESVATVTDGGLIALAGGHGTAVITAHTNGNSTYGAGNATYTITVNAPAPAPTGTTYHKVTATEDLTDGEYLIVYEDGNVAFDGALTTLDAVGNTVAVTINEGVIAGTSDIDAAVFTIGVTAGTIQSASGLYIGVSSYSNGLSTSENADEFVNALSIDADGNAVIAITTTSGDMTLRYNSASNQLRFRYYKSGQQAIQLYKKDVVTPPTPDYGSYQRNVTSGYFGTICLPQAGTIEGATLYEIGSYENNIIYVDEVLSGELEAGKPYIFQATADQLNVTYTSGTQVAAGEANGLHGFYNLSNMATDEAAQKNLDENAGNYILYQNAYWLVSGRAAYINNFRAYIKIGEINAQAPAPGRRRVAMAVHGEQVATGVENVQGDNVQCTKVLINGQLFILRGEKMYDAKGQLVK